jgi:hypothetical protein
MKLIQGMIGASLALLLAAGCGAADDGGNVEGSETATPSGTQTEATAGAELARVEFDDGNVVRFEELAGGVLVSEIGPLTNARHLVPREGLTALEAFKAMAPARTVPPALLQMHERMYPAGVTIAREPDDSAAPAAEEPSFDEDAEHDGQFQQSYPSAQFLAQLCDFPTNNGLNYKHANRTDVHSDTSMGIHTAYYAVAADIGTITLQVCAGKNAGGPFVGICSDTGVYNAGLGGSTFYDAGVSCPGDPNLFCKIFGCPKICTLRKVRFELDHGKISNNVRFHECARFTI